jgi:hypothetical protein
MTRPSRGISPIQEKARGNKMSKKEDMRKSMAPKPKKSSMKISAKSPLNAMSVGAANAPMPPQAGLRPPMPGMKAGGACKGYAKGGSIDGIAQKGKTRGKVC